MEYILTNPKSDDAKLASNACARIAQLLAPSFECA